MSIFDVLAYYVGMVGSFDGSGYNLQKFVVIVAEWLGYTIHVGLG